MNDLKNNKKEIMVFKPERIYHTRIAKNPEDNTFSVWFEDRPENLVTSLLYAVGFKVKSNEREFYYYEDASMMEFAEDLKATLSLGCFPFHVPYTPTYSNTQESIDADNFSVITFHYENHRGLSETESLLVFERIKERREGLAHILGVYKFGKRLQSYNATYRTGKAQARELLKNGVYQVILPTPFGAGCPARLDFDSKDKPYRHQTELTDDNLAANDESNDSSNEGAFAVESAREDLREKISDRSPHRYSAENQETNDRSPHRLSSREDLHEQINDRSNGRSPHRSNGGSLEETNEHLEVSVSLEDEEMRYVQISRAEEVPESFFDLFENKLLSGEEEGLIDPSQIRDEFNVLVSQELHGLDEQEVQSLWAIYSASERGLTILEQEYSIDEDHDTPTNYEDPVSEESQKGNTINSLGIGEQEIIEEINNYIQVSSVEVVKGPADWEQDLTFNNWTEMSAHYSSMDVVKLPHGYGLTFRVLWQNGDTMEVEIPLYADGYNPVIDPLIFGKQALTQLLKRINELEGRFLGKEANEKNKGGSAIAELKEWKNTLDFSLSDAERLKVERLNKPKIPIKRIEIDMEGRHFLSLVTLAEWQRFTKASKELENARSLFGLTDKVKVSLIWLDDTAIDVSIPVVTIPKSWTSEHWSNLVRVELGEDEEFKYQSSDSDPLLIVDEVHGTKHKMYMSVLEKAYWRGAEEDSELRIIIDGQAYNENELYWTLIEQLRQTSEEIQNLIGQEITTRFDVPKAYQEQQQNAQVPGTNKASFLESFLDEINNHYREENKSMDPIYKFLIDHVIHSDEMADLPMIKSVDKIPTVASIKNPSQASKHKALGAKKRFETNKKIEALIDSKKSSNSEFTEEDIELFRKYTGYGGLISQGATGAGILYEYYTSHPIIEKMWGLAYKYGFTGGSILEPSVGIGDFLSLAPLNVDITAYEINPYSATICQLLYPKAKVQNAAFETIFFNGFKHLKDNHSLGDFDLVIGNPPYGEFTGKYAGMGEKKFTKAKEYDHYFITRSLDLLRSGGLLVFIIASSFLDSGKSYTEVKKRIAAKAELKDAYRLPNGIFKSTDVGTDIVVFKKR